MQRCPNLKYKQQAQQFVQLASSSGKQISQFQFSLQQTLDARVTPSVIEKQINQTMSKFFKKTQNYITVEEALSLYNNKYRLDISVQQDEDSENVFSDQGYQILLEFLSDNNVGPLKSVFGKQRLQSLQAMMKKVQMFGRYYCRTGDLKDCSVLTQMIGDSAYYNFSQIENLSYSQSPDGKMIFWQRTPHGLVRLNTLQAVDSFLYRSFKRRAQAQNKKIWYKYYDQKKCLQSCQKTSKSQQRAFLQTLFKRKANDDSQDPGPKKILRK